jgi:hypothetical protein
MMCGCLLGKENLEVALGVGEERVTRKRETVRVKISTPSADVLMPLFEYGQGKRGACILHHISSRLHQMPLPNSHGDGEKEEEDGMGKNIFLPAP